MRALRHRPPAPRVACADLVCCGGATSFAPLPASETMATAKLVTLAVRTLAKPIATSLKHRATQDETFRKVCSTPLTQICIELAQKMHRTEMRLRANLVPGSEKLKVRPLNDSKVR